MNAKVILVLILVVVASNSEAKKNGGGGEKCRAKALCPKVEALEVALNRLSSVTQGNKEDLQKQIDDLTSELEELKNRPPPTFPPTTEPPFVCESPWVEFKSSCYLFSDEKKKWAESISKCDEYGAKLVSIKSQDKQIFVAGKLKGDSWLGMTDEANEGTWVWKIDGSAVDYFNWRGGEPNGNTGENFAMIYAQGEWNDCGPNYDWYYICQK